MYPDGICHVTGKTYSKAVRFDDLTYRLAQPETKDRIFSDWCDFHNSFDPSVHFQISCMNLSTDLTPYQDRLRIPRQQNDCDKLGAELENVMLAQFSKGNNGLLKSRYVVFSVEVDSPKQAKPRLELIETDVLRSFKKLGTKAYSMDGKERLTLLHNIFHMDTREQLQFDWSWLLPSGLNTKDFIAPSSFDFSSTRSFTMGGQYCAVSALNIMASRMDDELITKLMALNSNLIVSIQIQPMEQAAALKMIRRTMTNVDAMKISEQKKAVRGGYDMDILPRSITTYGEETEKMLDALQNQDERLFLFTVLLLNSSASPQKLKRDIAHVQSLVQQRNCSLIRLDFQQERGLNSCLPLGVNQVTIHRAMPTAGVAILLPFSSRELFQDGEAIYYGQNVTSNNLIMADRKRLRNPNGIFLGSPGSGKSFVAKREMLHVFFVTPDDILICDPESEYGPLVERLHGQVIRLAPNSKHYINPLDLDIVHADDVSPLTLKYEFVMSMFELILKKRGGLQADEVSVLDKAVQAIYRPYLADPKPENMPILEDLYVELLSIGSAPAKYLANTLEPYVNGSQNFFNHRTNVELNNRIVCYDIKEISASLKALGMLVIQDHVWSRVAANRALGKSTRYYADEFHLLLLSEQTAAYSAEMWKRFRKWGGIPTGLTQNIKDLLASPQIENIFDNSDFYILLNQQPGDREILEKRLNISPQQLESITQSAAGEGLTIYGDTILPFRDNFPKNTELYRLMNTKPNES